MTNDNRFALVIDDDYNTANVTAKILQLHGVEAEFRTDIDKASQLIERRLEEGKPYDLILCDGHMPGVPFATACIGQNLIDAENNTTQLIVMSGSTNKPEPSPGLNRINGLVTKPLNDALELYAKNPDTFLAQARETWRIQLQDGLRKHAAHDVPRPHINEFHVAPGEKITTRTR